MPSIDGNPSDNRIKQLVTLMGIIIFGTLAGGLYGILHDQLTYSISPEYYTKFKFYQFGLVDEGGKAAFEYPRLQVALVGIIASWWMGLPMASILGLFSFHSERKVMVGTSVRAFLVAIVITVVSGLYGLYEGFGRADHPDMSPIVWPVPDNIVDVRSFIAVSSMHNHSYAGGLLGLFGAIGYVVYRKTRLNFKSKGADA